MRGLKPATSRYPTAGLKSHLLQMRGLKHYAPKSAGAEDYVASFTDAWIETFMERRDLLAFTSHLLQMRGLKLKEAIAMMRKNLSHLLQMRGLKQSRNG